MPQKPIIISGAGLSSLLFARSLLRASIPFIIYEQDSSISFRAQGYRLRLSSEGLDAIESVLGPEEFEKFWQKCSKTGGAGVVAIDAVTGEPMPSGPSPAPAPAKDGSDADKAQEDNQPSEEKPPKTLKENLVSRDGKIVGCSRGEMRKFFLAGCEDYIHWSHRVTGYELTSSTDGNGDGEGGVRAIFADGTRSPEGELLVAADGLHSKIARQLSHGALKVYDTGARGIHGQAPTTAFRDLGEGVFRLVDTSRGAASSIFIITNVRPGDLDDPNIQFGWTMGGTPGVIQAPGDNYALIGKPAAEIAKSLTARWHPRFRPLFTQMDESEAAFWKITCSSPSGVPDWPNEARVTVMGDAVHSMTPAGGIGANTAVRDAALLGRLLAQQKGKCNAGACEGKEENVTAAYEREMRVYATEAVKTSYGLAHAQQGGITIVEGQTRLA